MHVLASGATIRDAEISEPIASAAQPQRHWLASYYPVWDRAGAMAVALLATGGLLYTVGAVVYARRRPDPAPRVFGYHEVFHVLVIAAAAVHFAAIAFYAV